jgi:Putative zinc-finger
MGCPEVRDLLPEYVLGTLDASSRDGVDRHLAWCAGCRKEAGELAEGAAALAVGLPSSEPSPEVRDRVVAVVRGGAPGAPRRRVAALAAAVAAVVASASIGWGLAVAGRGEPVDRSSSAAEAVTTLESFQEFLVDVGGAGELESARLRSPRGGPAGGGATLYESTQREGDSLVVVVGGLQPRRGPYTVILRSGGARLVAGTLEELSPGQMGLAEAFSRNLSGFGSVLVEDRAGRRVLSGSFES